MQAFCLLQYVLPLSLRLLLRHRGLKVSHCDVCHPHSVTTMHHPPCCSLSTPPVHLSPMPISASCARPPHGHLIPPSSCSSPSSTFRRKLPSFPPFSHFHGMRSFSMSCICSHLSHALYALPALSARPSPCPPACSDGLRRERWMAVSMSSRSPQ